MSTGPRRRTLEISDTCQKILNLLPHTHPTSRPRSTTSGNSRRRRLDLWLNCLSERQIEVQTGIPRKTAADWVRKKRQMSEIPHPKVVSTSTSGASKRPTTIIHTSLEATGRLPAQAEPLAWVWGVRATGGRARARMALRYRQIRVHICPDSFCNHGSFGEVFRMCPGGAPGGPGGRRRLWASKLACLDEALVGLRLRAP